MNTNGASAFSDARIIIPRQTSASICCTGKLGRQTLQNLKRTKLLIDQRIFAKTVRLIAPPTKITDDFLFPAADHSSQWRQSFKMTIWVFICGRRPMGAVIRCIGRRSIRWASANSWAQQRWPLDQCSSPIL